MTNIARQIQFETSSQVLDATTFLSASQQAILELFNQYDAADVRKQIIATKICSALMINMQIEEEIFHPAVKRTVKENGCLSAIAMEHSILKYLITEIESLDEDSSVYDIKVNVLNEHVKDHFAAKQTKLFPKVNACKKLDVWILGAQLAARKEELEMNPNNYAN